MCIVQNIEKRIPSQKLKNVLTSGPIVTKIINIIGGSETMDNIIITSIYIYIYIVHFDRVKRFIKSYFYFFFCFFLVLYFSKIVQTHPAHVVLLCLLRPATVEDLVLCHTIFYASLPLLCVYYTPVGPNTSQHMVPSYENNSYYRCSGV